MDGCEPCQHEGIIKLVGCGIMEQILKSGSKVLGILIFFSGAIYGFMYHDPEVLMNGWMYSALLVGTKTAIQGIENSKAVAGKEAVK